MNKKRIVISPEAIQVISTGIKWGGHNGKTTAKIRVRLDRDLYTKVNKGLEALGGKWNRKAQAHLFDEDPRPAINEMAQSGSVEVEVTDTFFTPLPLVERMVKEADLAKWTMILLEPSAGSGRIADALVASGEQHSVLCCEINENLRTNLVEKGHRLVGRDFMQYELPRYDEDGSLMFMYDRIVMNPPFSKRQDVKHVLHAWSLLSPGGRLVAIVGEGCFFREHDLERQFRDLVATRGWSEELPYGTFRESGTMVATRLVVMDKEKAK